jgi:long-chain fatty acid transport protein
MKRALCAVLVVVGLSASRVATATDGYFSHGYGVKSQGMGGVGIALSQDALAAATNPAGMVSVGDRVDAGATWFRPNRTTELGSSFGPFAGTYSGNDQSEFLIPEFGYNKAISPDTSLGVSVFGNGGMNTGYADLNSRTAGFAAFAFGSPDTTAGLLGHGKAGVDLQQLFIAPTWSTKLNENHAVGVAVNLAYQTFSATGLNNFDNAMSSAHPGSVTNNGTDSSTGYGARVGWTGHVASAVTLGATYQTTTSMGKFSKYKGLFAEQGGFDIPANYGVGIAAKVMPQFTVAGDVETIQYSGVKAIADSGNAKAQLGANNGPGFGWRDVTVYKVGAGYEVSTGLTLRGGWNHLQQPIPTDQTYFNTLAPGVVEDHLTLGAPWTLANNGEVSAAYMHAFANTVKGKGPASGIDITMYQDSIGIAYGMKL